MATMAREAWTDERLDDLTKRVDAGFARNDAEFRALRNEMNARFNATDTRFDAMQRTMIIGFASIVASICGSATAAILTSHL
jgi:tellurite resistance protein